MKELTVEEKAKAYDEVREKIAIRFGSNVADEIFSQFEMSKDERIRKVIYGWIYTQSSQFFDSGFSKEEMLAWLEKQGEKKQNPYSGTSFEYNGHTWGMCARDNGVDILCDKHIIEHFETQDEQKPIDNVVEEPNFFDDFRKTDSEVEPKFKVGDYIISNNNSEIIYHITGTGINELGNSDYVCEHVGREKEYNGRIYNMSQDKVDANFRLWTIQDAEEGDVLVCPKYAGDIIPNIFIFKNIETKDNDVFYYCSFLEKFRTESYVANADPINTDFYPATKEQCDLLFQKMKDAGYEWDAEKKELKKIEQKPAWSEEDERCWSIIIAEFSKYAGKSVSKDEWMRCNDWLNSLRDRVQPKQELSEDVEAAITLLKDIAEEQEKDYCPYNVNDLEKPPSIFKLADLSTVEAE